MSCAEFDGQVVRLEQFQDIADRFVRVRLAQIEHMDLKVFDFDYDLTFMVLFMNSSDQVYARYGGRCEKGPDERQSLAGLRYTMESVLSEHEAKRPRVAPRETGKPFYIREIAPARGLGRCIHCHQAKEVIYDRLDQQGKWNRDLAYRYPLPENLGFQLEVDRGNIVQSVTRDSPADDSGLQSGDLITSLNRVPIHAFGDAQFALDRAPKRGLIEVQWQRAGREMRGRIALPDRWRRTDVSWRPSLQNFVASAGVYGKDLTPGEKAEFGLAADRLAFRQKDAITPQAKKAGIQPGDIIIGVDDQELKSRAYKFLFYIRSNYLKGEVVTVNLIRNGKRMRLAMKLE